MSDYESHPTPKGATPREQAIVARMHRAAGLNRDPDLRPVLSESLELIFGLIEARGKRRDFDEQWDRPHDGG